MDDRDRAIMNQLCKLVGLQLRALDMKYKDLVVRENVLKQVLGQRGLLTDEQWHDLRNEVQAGIAVQLALGVSDEEQRQVDDALAKLGPMLADPDGAVLKPLVDSLMQMNKRLA